MYFGKQKKALELFTFVARVHVGGTSVELWEK